MRLGQRNPVRLLRRNAVLQSRRLLLVPPSPNASPHNKVLPSRRLVVPSRPNDAWHLTERFFSFSERLSRSIQESLVSRRERRLHCSSKPIQPAPLQMDNTNSKFSRLN